MDRATQIAAELKILRTLCDASESHERRLELLQSSDQSTFIVPEHQVVFESIRQLFPSGLISAARIAVHLNNRGFPDIDLNSYFPAKPTDGAPRKSAGNERSLRSNQ